MPKLKIYISSTYKDMADIEVRNYLIDRIQNGLPEDFELTRIMEQMDGDFQNVSNIDFCLQQVRKADLYIIIVGERYGSSPDFYTDENFTIIQNNENLSFTEIEYVTAQKTLERKFYGIYKFFISNIFFQNAQKENHSDLSNPVLNQKYNAFINRINTGASMITIDTPLELERKINAKLTEFLAFSNNFLRLNISDQNKMLIDRVEQKKIIEEKRNPDITSVAKPLGQKSKSVVFVFNSTCEKDDFVKFGMRIKNEIVCTESNPDLTVPEYISFSELIAATFDRESEEINAKILDRILTKCSIFLFDRRNNACIFETLDIDLINQKVLNKFIYINIELMGHDKRDSFSIKIITQFIQKIENIIKEIKDENGRPIMSSNNLFFVLNLINDNDNEYQKYNNKIADSLHEIECINLTKLNKVQAQDVISWLKEIITKKGMQLDVNEIYKFIFSDIDNQPKYYKEYIDLLEKKIRL